MKEYTIQLEITEGSDEFWEEIERDSKSGGVEEILESIKRCLDTEGWIMSNDCKVKLVKFLI